MRGLAVVLQYVQDCWAPKATRRCWARENCCPWTTLTILAAPGRELGYTDDIE